MKYEKKTFRGEAIDLDENEYVDCRFVDCTLVFAGGRYSLAGCQIEGRFALSLKGHCANCLSLLQMLATYSPAARDYVIGMLDPHNVVISVDKT